jgi:hypothetical protein
MYEHFDCESNCAYWSKNVIFTRDKMNPCNWTRSKLKESENTTVRVYKLCS